MIVIRRIFVVILWYFTTYLAIIVFGSMISGGIIGYKLKSGGEDFSQDEVFERLAGGFAGEAFVEKYCELIMLLALLFSVMGTVAGFLPGTGNAKGAKLSAGSKG